MGRVFEREEGEVGKGRDRGRLAFELGVEKSFSFAFSSVFLGDFYRAIALVPLFIIKLDLLQ